MVWKGFPKASALETVVRQSGNQEQFKTVLNSLGNNTTTAEQAQWLQNFQWDNLKDQME